MIGGVSYKIVVVPKYHEHGKRQWVCSCGHPDCGGDDSPAEYPTACREAACAQKAAWDHARHAHADDTAVIEVQGEA